MAGAQATGSTRQATQGLLGIYLNDHLAGATGGVELARRVAAARRQEQAGDVLLRFAADVAADRAALLEIMTTLGVPVRLYKVCAGWIGEKAGRLKLNGRLLSRSPLSSLEELEMMCLGVAARRPDGARFGSWQIPTCGSTAVGSMSSLPGLIVN